MQANTVSPIDHEAFPRVVEPVSFSFRKEMLTCLGQTLSSNSLKLSLWFTLWYFLTVVHNISTKKLLVDLPLPAFVGTLNLFLGIPLFLPIIANKLDKFENSVNVEAFSMLGLVHAMGHISTCLSLNAGSVSFTHVVKSAEPIFASIFSAILLKQVFPTYVYYTLIPIILGVSLASTDSSIFSLVGFLTAMASNVCYQLRSVLAKVQMTASSNSKTLNATSTQLSPANIFRLVTISAAFISLPFMLLIEGPQIVPVWNVALKSGVSLSSLLSNICISSWSFYLYNEVAFWVLGVVNPITHSIGNCLKRVVVIALSSVILRTRHSWLSIAGCILAVLGTLAYSIATNRARAL